MVEQFDDVGVVFTCFVGEVPAGETFVVAISLERFVDEGFVDFDFLPPGSSPPVESAIVGSEVEFETELVGEGEEHFSDVFVDW